MQGLTNPVVAAAALIALLLVIGADEAVGALVTLAHEGAHALVNTLARRRVESLEVTGGFSDVTRSIDRGCALAGSSSAPPTTRPTPPSSPATH